MSGKPMADSGKPTARWRGPAAYKNAALPPHAEDARRWAAFCASLGDRIAKIRADEAPLLCPTCGSTAPLVVERKTCPMCQAFLPLSAFGRNRSRLHGVEAYCRACLKPGRAAKWQQYKRRKAASAPPTQPPAGREPLDGGGS